MIDIAEQIYQPIEQMGRMQRILQSYRNEILTRNPRNFAVFAEEPLEQLRQLQQQIDEYIRHMEERLQTRDAHTCVFRVGDWGGRWGLTSTYRQSFC